MPDKELFALIVQVTGLDAQNKICKLIQSTLNNLKAYADFGAKDVIKNPKEFIEAKKPVQNKEDLNKKDICLTYTINLNLPATTDQAVFNAIFKSLKEHLLSDE